jgi:polysaccharide deacetylase family protein (PEP-CTERM system associated)
MINALTFDIEDWFHILDIPTSPPLEEWNEMDSLVETHTNHVLALLSEYGVKATFFILGWVADSHPGLVEAVVSGGHEVASHGYAHKLIYHQSKQEFADDVGLSREVLTRLSGTPVIGYRSPGFSVTPETSWALHTLLEQGFRYDSSIFPAARSHGGYPGATSYPHRIVSKEDRYLWEFPISTVKIFRWRLCLFGGGYFRLFPWRLIYSGVKRINRAGYPVVVYLHGRELDPRHPRLPMPWNRRFMSYVGLGSTERKLRRLLEAFPFAPVRDVLDLMGDPDAGARTTPPSPRR